MYQSGPFVLSPRIFNWDSTCFAFSELFHSIDLDCYVDPVNHKLIIDTLAQKDLVGQWLIDAMKDFEVTITLLSNITLDPEINAKAVEYLKLVKELDELSEGNINVIFVVHSDDLDEYLNDKFSQIEEIQAISEFVDWNGLALRERDNYMKLDLSYNKIGFEGLWLYR